MRYIKFYLKDINLQLQKMLHLPFFISRTILQLKLQSIEQKTKHPIIYHPTTGEHRADIAFYGSSLLYKSN